MPELRTARENARLETGSQRGRNSHQIGVLAIYDLQGLSYGRTELMLLEGRHGSRSTGSKPRGDPAWLSSKSHRPLPSTAERLFAPSARKLDQQRSTGSGSAGEEGRFSSRRLPLRYCPRAEWTPRPLLEHLSDC